jgi:hypothetical protein
MGNLNIRYISFPTVNFPALFCIHFQSYVLLSDALKLTFNAISHE